MKLYSAKKNNTVSDIYKKGLSLGLSFIMAASMTSYTVRKDNNNSKVSTKSENIASLNINNDTKYDSKLDNLIIEKELEDETVVTTDIDETMSEDYSYEFTDNNESTITVDNMDLFTRAEIIKFICDKYNLTEFEFKVIASVVYHETYANNYDDVYCVINTIYNRTKSKLWVNSISSFTGLDGHSMYAQVIAPYQFDGYIKNSAGYDYETLLNTVIYDGTKPFETTLDAIFEFLLSEKCIHNFLSFKGVYWEVSNSEKMKPGFGVTNWVRYTKLGNIYHDPLTADDLIDENYNLAQQSMKVLTKAT